MSNLANAWQPLLERALAILDDAAPRAGGLLDDWTLGGGTMLMFDLNHRASHDIDVFVSDPQVLALLSPKVNHLVEDLTRKYIEDTLYLKLLFPDGEIDFVVSGLLTRPGWQTRELLGRTLRTETPAEIIAKKVHFRADQFKGRDLYDLACVLQRMPAVMLEVAPFLRAKRGDLLTRLSTHSPYLRAEYQQVLRLGPAMDFEVAVALVTAHLEAL